MLRLTLMWLLALLVVRDASSCPDAGDAFFTRQTGTVGKLLDIFRDSPEMQEWFRELFAEQPHLGDKSSLFHFPVGANPDTARLQPAYFRLLTDIAHFVKSHAVHVKKGAIPLKDGRTSPGWSIEFALPERPHFQGARAKGISIKSFVPAPMSFGIAVELYARVKLAEAEPHPEDARIRELLNVYNRSTGSPAELISRTFWLTRLLTQPGIKDRTAFRRGLEELNVANTIQTLAKNIPNATVKMGDDAAIFEGQILSAQGDIHLTVSRPSQNPLHRHFILASIEAKSIERVEKPSDLNSAIRRAITQFSSPGERSTFDASGAPITSSRALSEIVMSRYIALQVDWPGSNLTWEKNDQRFEVEQSGTMWGYRKTSAGDWRRYPMPNFFRTVADHLTRTVDPRIVQGIFLMNRDGRVLATFGQEHAIVQPDGPVAWRPGPVTTSAVELAASTNSEESPDASRSSISLNFLLRWTASPGAPTGFPVVPLSGTIRNAP